MGPLRRLRRQHRHQRPGDTRCHLLRRPPGGHRPPARPGPLRIPRIVAARRLVARLAVRSTEGDTSAGSPRGKLTRHLSDGSAHSADPRHRGRHGDYPHLAHHRPTQIERLPAHRTIVRSTDRPSARLESSARSGLETEAGVPRPHPERAGGHPVEAGAAAGGEEAPAARPTDPPRTHRPGRGGPGTGGGGVRLLPLPVEQGLLGRLRHLRRRSQRRPVQRPAHRIGQPGRRDGGRGPAVRHRQQRRRAAERHHQDRPRRSRPRARPRPCRSPGTPS